MSTAKTETALTVLSAPSFCVVASTSAWICSLLSHVASSGIADGSARLSARMYDACTKLGSSSEKTSGASPGGAVSVCVMSAAVAFGTERHPPASSTCKSQKPHSSDSDASYDGGRVCVRAAYASTADAAGTATLKTRLVSTALGTCCMISKAHSVVASR